MTNELPFDDENQFLEELGTSESAEDLGPLAPKAVSQAVLNSADWTAETLLRQIDKGNITLNPKFQRRDAWTPDRKSKFIESLIMGFPVPQLVLAYTKERKGSYIVIDGKQRLLSLRQFAAKNDDPVYTSLRLTGLTVRTDLLRKNLTDLALDPALADDLSAFENQTIRTVVIRNWPNEDFLYQVFLRLNTGSVPLSPQELRQALHPGPFVDFADDKAATSPAMMELLGLAKPDFRMRDVELLVRFYAFKNFLHSYTGNLKAFLDLTCAQLNDQWEEMQPRIVAQLTQFEAAYDLARQIFGHANVCRKWTGSAYEKRFNRAIFDVIMHYFSDPEVRDAVTGHEVEVEGLFKDLCVTNPRFLTSIERTTKSLEATLTRLASWAESLNTHFNMTIHVPKLRDGRIT